MGKGFINFKSSTHKGGRIGISHKKKVFFIDIIVENAQLNMDTKCESTKKGAQSQRMKHNDYKKMICSTCLISYKVNRTENYNF